MTWEMHLSYEYGGRPTLTFAPDVPYGIKAAMLAVAMQKVSEDANVPIGELLAVIGKSFAETYAEILDGKGEDE